MYRIDKSTNDITQLQKRRFSELGFKERENLQEWIAKNPEVLGEELLIIQKEFDGFNDTKERLDLLALDSDGGLVIIENKLDDTGRDVVWQSLKYTSYCSTLTTSQIISIFQKHLDDTGVKDDAKSLILEFLDREEEDLLLNTKEQDQRIILVANNYRKEVTSTILWLLDHQVRIQAFKAEPYSFGEDLFLQIEQIIPLPETKEFMIDAIVKQKEDKSKSVKVLKTNAFLIDFWSNFKHNLKNNNVSLIENVSPRASFSIGTWKGQGKFCYCIGRDTIRVELYFGNDVKKEKFEFMYNHKDEIESKFKGQIIWQKLENKKASRIKHEMPVSDFKNKRLSANFKDKENWGIWMDWYRNSMQEFYDVMYPIWSKY
jgi:hypothetical protein